MPSIMPDVESGGVIIRDESGAATPIVGTVRGAAALSSAFGMNGPQTAHPEGCIIVKPKELNAISSEILRLAVELDPTGTWDLESLSNLATAFEHWKTAFSAAMTASLTSSFTTAIASSLTAFAPLNSPHLNGVPLAPTAALNTNTTQIATMAALKAAIDDLKSTLMGGAPSAALDTLLELGNQLLTDESVVAALTTTVAGKLAKVSNLSDLTDAAAARGNLGLGSAATHPASDFQSSDQDLTDIAGLARAKGAMIAGSATAWGLLAVGTNGQIPYADSTQALGIRWGDPASVAVPNVTWNTGGIIAKITAATATDIPLVVVGAAGQSGNLQELRTSTGTVVSSTSPAGVASFTSNVSAATDVLSFTQGSKFFAVTYYSATNVILMVGGKNAVQQSAADLTLGNDAGTTAVRICTGGTDRIVITSSGMQFQDGSTQVTAGASAAEMRAAQIALAELKGDRINMPNGIVDPFADTSDVATITNTGLSSGKFLALGAAQTFDATVHGALAALSNGNRDFTIASTAAQTFARGAAVLPSTGKWYWEFTNLVANPYYAGVGIAPGTDNFTTSPIATAYGVIWSQYGSYDHTYITGNSDTFTAWAGMSSPSAANDVIMIAYDADTGKLWFGKNGTWWNTSGTANPATGTDPRYTGIAAGNMYIYANLFYTPYGSLRLNAGQAAYAYSPPSGFTGIGTVQNMTLISSAFTAAAVPTVARIGIQIKAIDAITINTDVIAYVSRDGGTTWTAATLVLEMTREDGTAIYVHDGLSISGQPSGTSMKWKIVTANNKNVEIHGIDEFKWR